MIIRDRRGDSEAALPIAYLFCFDGQNCQLLCGAVQSKLCLIRGRLDGVEISRIAVLIDYSRANGKFLCFLRFSRPRMHTAHRATNIGIGGHQIVWVRDHSYRTDFSFFERLYEGY